MDSRSLRRLRTALSQLVIAIDLALGVPLMLLGGIPSAMLALGIWSDGGFLFPLFVFFLGANWVAAAVLRIKRHP